MADVRIQDLLATTTVADNDLFIVEDNADTKKITRANLRLNLMTFPATQVPSSNPNTLDDYEEGTWAPEVISSTTAGVGTYTVQAGRYTKIGNVVHFSIHLAWTAHTGTGNMEITLPFQNGPVFTPVAIVPSSLTYSNQLGAMVIADSTRIRIYTFSSNAAFGAGLPMDTNATVFISGSYMTS